VKLWIPKSLISRQSSAASPNNSRLWELEMKKYLVAAALLVLTGAATAGIATLNGVSQAGNGSVANPYDFGALVTAPKFLRVDIAGSAGAHFEEYANFTISTPSDVKGSANTYSLALDGIFGNEINNLLVDVWDNTHPNGNNLIASFSGNSVTTWLGTLAAGQYHLDISGDFGPDAFGGQYSVALRAVPAVVPEPQTLALMLAGLGVMGFMSRRRRMPA
jgi:hypothetical protein